MTDAAAARTTISSLNDHKSSIEPPPLATINRSGRATSPVSGNLLNPSIAAAICSADPAPCTFTPQTSTRTPKRSDKRCRMSRITAPVGLVTTPIDLGNEGRGRLRAASNSPSSASLRRRSSSCFKSAPSPAISTSLTIS